MRPGWVVELAGAKIDLDLFRQHLAEPIDTWVEDGPAEEGLGLLLRRDKWDNFTEAALVYIDANQQLARLKGMALVISPDSKPVTIKHIAKLDSNGKLQPITFAAVGYAYGLSRVLVQFKCFPHDADDMP